MDVVRARSLAFGMNCLNHVSSSIDPAHGRKEGIQKVLYCTVHSGSYSTWSSLDVSKKASTTEEMGLSV